MKLRRATMDDAEAILKWRNDERTRAGSFTQNIISLDTHKKWMESKLMDSNCCLFILTEGDELLGNIRLDMEGESGEVGEISYVINPDHRGKGYGKVILRALEEEVPSWVRVLTGFVKTDNIASQKCFEALGYVKLNAGDVIGYIKLLDKDETRQG